MLNIGDKMSVCAIRHQHDNPTAQAYHSVTPSTLRCRESMTSCVSTNTNTTKYDHDSRAAVSHFFRNFDLSEPIKWTRKYDFSDLINCACLCASQFDVCDVIILPTIMSLSGFRTESFYAQLVLIKTEIAQLFL